MVAKFDCELVLDAQKFSQTDAVDFDDVGAQREISNKSPGVIALGIFCRAQFELDAAIDEKGTTLRRSLQSLAAKSERARNLLAMVPSLSPDVFYLYEWYCEIRDRAAPQVSTGRLTYNDFDAWQRFKNKRVEPWEFSALCAIDESFLDVRYGRGKKVIDDGQ